MSYHDYTIPWSDGVISMAEQRLKAVHRCIMAFAEDHGYDAATGCRVDPIGSFMLRTCIHNTPYVQYQRQRGVGVDLVLTMPTSVCSMADVEGGLYLEKRHAFLLELEQYLATNLVVGDADAKAVPMAGRVTTLVTRVDVAGCSGGEKQVLRVFVVKAPAGSDGSVAPPGCSSPAELRALQRELFHVDIHLRPTTAPGKIVSEKATRKHALYSHLVLEDYLGPEHLKKLHAMSLTSSTLLRAVVILKCWAHHVGLTHSSSESHPEALNGFIVSMMVCKLLEEGIVSPSMSEENIVRAVWVQLSCGYFCPVATSPARSSHASPRPMAEATEAVPMLRLATSGERSGMNVLFRTSGAFFTRIIKRAAETALQLPSWVQVFSQTPFLPLGMRMDVCLVLSSLPPIEADRSVGVKTGGLRSSARDARAAQLQELLTVALGVRSEYVTVWATGADAASVALRLTSEAEGRNRLTRGPPIEDTKAVDAFNTFWGSGVASTRQFPDGGIFRCVLWPLENEAPATVVLPPATVIRRVLEFALRKHVGPGVGVAVLLSGLDGVLAERVGAEWRDTSPLTQHSLHAAAREVERMFRDLPHSVAPCRIHALDVIAASERLTEVFPVRPHLALTRTTDDLGSAAYAALSIAPCIEPIHCVLAIDDNHKIPDALEPIGTMKSAIAAQFSKALQHVYGGVAKVARVFCSGQAIDIIISGFLFRVHVAHYREVSLLKALGKTAEAALLERKLFWTAKHATYIRSIAAGHQSFAAATRLSKRWVSAMLLSDFVLPEAIELLVAKAYLSVEPPKTAACGFLRFLQLLVGHDWRQPLRLPQSEVAVIDEVRVAEEDPTVADGDGDAATAAGKGAKSKAARRRAGPALKLAEHQGMFIATYYAPTESPFTEHTPRRMIVHRLVGLARGAVALLLRNVGHCSDVTEAEMVRSVFTSDAAAFDFEMPFHVQVVLHPDRAIAREHAAIGQNALQSAAALTPLPRLWQLDELGDAEAQTYVLQLAEREPAAHCVRTIRQATKERCMAFYDALGPSSVAVIEVRPQASAKHAKALHDEILQLSRGALLPAAPGSFRITRPPSTAEPATDAVDAGTAVTAPTRVTAPKRRRTADAPPPSRHTATNRQAPRARPEAPSSGTAAGTKSRHGSRAATVSSPAPASKARKVKT